MSSAAIRMSYGVDSVQGPKSRQGPLLGLTIPEKAVRGVPSLAVSDAFRLWYADTPLSSSALGVGSACPVVRPVVWQSRQRKATKP